ncbi:hypothetical protein E4665_03020 [Sporolactobacillus shoreae]|uniref:precorrin-2 dehydrogenase n=1 Tax=Sporolactobacillus shoreae TaxID=1465501 RepID=A0A4Z0GTE0_9BACL|nr:hypothetical protein [Sporolactobacillus shoreae]TGA99934.1 hypothetical protein E4665_03020 [Sporolactobacillus shoreae]
MSRFSRNPPIKKLDQCQSSTNCVVVRRGRLTLTVSTGGASPFYAKKLRDDLSNGLNDDLEGYLDFLSLLRQQILEKHLDRGLREKCLKSVLQPEFHNKTEQLKLLEGLDQWIQGQADKYGF